MSSAAPTGHPSVRAWRKARRPPGPLGVLTLSLCLCARCRDQGRSHTPLACAYRHLRNFNELATSVREECLAPEGKEGKAALMTFIQTQEEIGTGLRW